MKTIKVLALATVAVSIIASTAYAGGNERQRQIGEENADYFYHMNQGKSGSNQAAVQNPDYEFTGRPEQRMAQRGQAYFQKAGYKGGDVQPFNYQTGVSDYPFRGSVLSAEDGGYIFSPAVKR